MAGAQNNGGGSGGPSHPCQNSILCMLSAFLISIVCHLFLLIYILFPFHLKPLNISRNIIPECQINWCYMPPKSRYSSRYHVLV